MNVLLLSSRLRLDLGPSVGDDALTDVLTIDGENQTKTTSAISRVSDVESNLRSDQLGAKELTALEVPWLRGRYREE